LSSAIIESLKSEGPSKDEWKIVCFQKGGFSITVGRNSFSNERLVSEHPHRDCLWMHAMAARGSHLVLCLSGVPHPSDDIVQYAASLALRFSHSEARTVSVSLLRDVFKPDNAGPGIWKTRRPILVEVAA
jgi:predicted ribosome quality control (RQC) complex YloA/Tae2 family protein